MELPVFILKKRYSRNWTRGEGLLPAYFNASAGAVRKNKGFVFGSADGAIELPDECESSRIISSPD